MSTTPVGAKALKVWSERSGKALAIGEQITKRPKLKILEEEEFVERVEKIIERDFFPYLETVRKQSDYLDALESQDSIRIAEAEKQLGKTPQVDVGHTPSKEDWDDEDWIKNTPGPSKPVSQNDKEDKLKKELAGISLSEFMAKNTSEDNDSFGQIMAIAEEKRRQKLDWIYKPEQEQHAIDGDQTKTDTALMPPPGAPLALTDARSSKQLDSWRYRAHNSVMYYPVGAPLTDREVQNLKDSQTKIIHGATRLSVRPWSTLTNPKVEPAAPQQPKGDGFWNGVIEKVGIDGKQSWEIASPKVNGFSFVATPSPRPGVGESPLMTWGEVESTPYLIDASGDSSKFHMKEPSEREKLAFSLAEKVSLAKKKQKSLKVAQDHCAHGSTPQSPRFSGLSPAAKRLAVGKLGINRGADRKLIASYTPSPGQNLTGRFDTPSSRVTPFPSPSPQLFVTKTPETNASIAPQVKKPKASDFF
ncbi:protein DGCR14-like [Tropilaelaps mercedesae]|uniref:Protein DGCR14-like n=1 Tax=Tropilaelaps mercedesae TaxID=418985 RepID=A0A1V9XP35_9ACAR|nr:protein DGCR14-like [Tropilaelaps mercedesae]